MSAYLLQPGESSVQDSALTRHSTERLPKEAATSWTEESLKKEVEFLKESSKRTRWKMSTAVER